MYVIRVLNEPFLYLCTGAERTFESEQEADDYRFRLAGEDISRIDLYQIVEYKDQYDKFRDYIDHKDTTLLSRDLGCADCLEDTDD